MNVLRMLIEMAQILGMDSPETINNFMRFDCRKEKKKGFKFSDLPSSHIARSTVPVKEPFKRINRRMGRM